MDGHSVCLYVSIGWMLMNSRAASLEKCWNACVTNSKALWVLKTVGSGGSKNPMKYHRFEIPKQIRSMDVRYINIYTVYCCPLWKYRHIYLCQVSTLIITFTWIGIQLFLSKSLLLCLSVIPETFPLWPCWELFVTVCCDECCVVLCYVVPWYV